MAARDNYDSSGLDTGAELGALFAGLELQYVVNRKQIFKNAIKSENFFRAVLQQIKAYNEANALATQSTMIKAGEIVREALTKAYNAGISSVDKSVAMFKKQGYAPPKTPYSILNDALDAGIISASFVLAGLALHAQRDATSQITQIASLVDNSAPDRSAEIDRSQAALLKRGISGRTQINGAEISMDNYAEMAIRSESTQVLREATGERQAQYGINLVLMSAHPSACEDCRRWMGKVLINDISAGGTPDGRHELLSEAIADGWGHYNCRCNYVGHVEGLDNPGLYDNEKLSVQETAKRYAVEQQQRYNERGIREWKRRAEGSLSEMESANAWNKVKEWQARQRALEQVAEEKGVPFYRQYNREQIGGITLPSNALVNLFGVTAA